VNIFLKERYGRSTERFSSARSVAIVSAWRFGVQSRGKHKERWPRWLEVPEFEEEQADL